MSASSLKPHAAFAPVPQAESSHPLLFMGATHWERVLQRLFPCCICRLSSMSDRSPWLGWGLVGGATGAVMTAATMIFEMTRDYDIVLPMILAGSHPQCWRAAPAIAREHLYLKLLRRGHVIPKALHANMFLVRRAREVMDKDMVFAPVAKPSRVSSRYPTTTVACAMSWSLTGIASWACCGLTPRYAYLAKAVDDGPRDLRTRRGAPETWWGDHQGTKEHVVWRRRDGVPRFSAAVRRADPLEP